MKDKLIYTTIGYGFLLLNLYALTHNRAIFAIGFAVTAAIMFIKAIRIKND